MVYADSAIKCELLMGFMEAVSSSVLGLDVTKLKLQDFTSHLKENIYGLFRDI